MINASLFLLVIKTMNVEFCLEFYRRIGLTFVEEKHGSGPIHYSCSLNDTVFEIYPVTSKTELSSNAGDSVRLGFRVESLDNILDELEKVGAKIVSMPTATEFGYRAVVLDPDGRKVELMETKSA